MKKQHDANESRSTKRLVAWGSAFTVLLIFAFLAWAAPKQLTTAKPGDCAACHGQEKVFSPAHVDTKDMIYKDCSGCHEKAGPRRLTGKMPGSHFHQLKGVTCERCHGKAGKQEAVPMKQCLTCHDAEKLAQQTAKLKPENPHTSPHYGTELDCNLCHHQHQKSENFCNQCHTYDFVVP